MHNLGFIHSQQCRISQPLTQRRTGPGGGGGGLGAERRGGGGAEAPHF